MLHQTFRAIGALARQHEWRYCTVDAAELDPSECSNLGRSKTLNTNRLTLTLTSTLEEGEEEEVNETLKQSRVKKTKVENEEE